MVYSPVIGNLNLGNLIARKGLGEKENWVIVDAQHCPRFYQCQRIAHLLFPFLGDGCGLAGRKAAYPQGDRELRLLSDSLPYLIKNGLADSTHGKYSRAWEKWVTWSREKSLPGRPANPYDVAIYISHLFFVKNNKGAVTAAFYGINWGHHVVGLYSPTDNPLVKLAYEGALRCCSCEKRRKDPITVETIKEVVSKFSGENSHLMDLRFVTVCLIGFAGFLRIEELLNTQLKQVPIFWDHMTIFLPKSKTDQHREGETVIIAKTYSEFCPVEHVIFFLHAAKLDLNKHKEAFLIPALHKTKTGYNASQHKGIAYTRMREVFKEYMSTVKKPGENLGLHSLRSGGASSAAHHGVPDRLISKQGRWASEKARNGYIKDDRKTRMSVTLSLGL